ncbi:MAG: hypothetical protein WCE25_08895 [Nitrososphaeraceae archaeon]
MLIAISDVGGIISAILMKILILAHQEPSDPSNVTFANNIGSMKNAIKIIEIEKLM